MTKSYNLGQSPLADRVLFGSLRRWIVRGKLRSRRGLTIIEVLIAVVITLIMLLVMLRAFRFASGEITKGRANLDMAEQLRAASEMLRSDLAGVTVPLRPWHTGLAEPQGYFSLKEGPARDNTTAADSQNPQQPGPLAVLGDIDDILAMTVRASDRPFRGRVWDSATNNYVIRESNLAEVIWFTVRQPFLETNPNTLHWNDRVTVYRRVLLILPALGIINDPNSGNADEFFRNNDISAVPIGGGYQANSLGDLARRENRYARNRSVAAYPHFIQRTWLANRRMAGQRLGEDVMLTDVAAFDVRVFSPNALVDLVDDSMVVQPSDLNYTGSTVAGAYVDLGYNVNRETGDRFNANDNAWFANHPDPRSQPSNATIPQYTYYWCTFTGHYEYDGHQQGTAGIDPATSGNPAGVRETYPPYSHPIRALQVTLRVVDRQTGQVRQETVRQSFVPQ